MKRILMAIACSAPIAAYAQFPFIGSGPFTVIDPVELNRRIADNAAALQRHLEKLDILMVQQVRNTLDTGHKVDAINNAAANQIVRSGQRAEEIQNLQVLRDFRSAYDACLPYGTSISMEELFCDQLDDLIQGLSDANNASVKVNPALTELITGEKADPNQSGEIPRPKASELNLESIDAIMGYPVTHSEQLNQDVKKFITVMLPPFQPNTAQIDWSEEDLLGALRDIVTNNMPSQVMNRIATRRHESNGQSEAGLLDLFAREHFSSHRTEALTADDQMTSAAVSRERYISMAFRVWRTVQEYDLSLEREVVAATQLIQLIDRSN